ncbi:hypothetical protein RCL_jg19000.t1 [Rhizophagus clarus]|uniref:Uncharacterized protein n=1 Tax=Rhizophagus clarus TaxID=94130 RepID=A0A8H3LYS6_9GLOM|nr:hypothetical protein RCL_jg19000.t1 [Rhizophagus clarus]
MKRMTRLLELRTIKCCQTKSTTRLLELRTIKCCQTKSMTGFLGLRTIKGHWCSESNDITFTILKWNSLRRG